MDENRRLSKLTLSSSCLLLKASCVFVDDVFNFCRFKAFSTSLSFSRVRVVVFLCWISMEMLEIFLSVL